MHELNAIRAAIRGAVSQRDAELAAQGRSITQATASGAYRHLELDILDPTRATPAAVQVFASQIIEELGLGRVSFDVFVRAARCAMCDRMTHAEPGDPVCAACGAPVPRTEGPAIAARWTRPISVVEDDLAAQEVGSGLADRRHRRRATPVVPR